MRSNRLILVFCILLAGCHKHVSVAALPPAAPPQPAPAPTVVPFPVPSPPNVVIPPPPSPLVAMDRAFAAGNYDDAARGYEEYLRANTKDQRDHALFYLGLCYALRPSGTTDWTRPSSVLKELVDQYPNSPYRAPAGLILSLHSDLEQLSADSKQRDLRIKQLTTELDRLKKIDADRRKRP
ncbi:MAG TPA: hypothetical protein VKY31_13845 [Terriglobia bacterium]|nr:hypothetical protein [Terriglobia bacterium]